MVVQDIHRFCQVGNTSLIRPGLNRALIRRIQPGQRKLDLLRDFHHFRDLNPSNLRQTQFGALKVLSYVLLISTMDRRQRSAHEGRVAVRASRGQASLELWSKRRSTLNQTQLAHQVVILQVCLVDVRRWRFLSLLYLLSVILNQLLLPRYPATLPIRVLPDELIVKHLVAMPYLVQIAMRLRQVPLFGRFSRSGHAVVEVLHPCVNLR